MRKIYTRVKKQRKDRVSDYLNKLFAANYGFPATYGDKTFTRTECTAGKNRSLDAIYQVAISKFGNLTKKTFCSALRATLLKSHNKDGSRRNLAILYCPDIDKWVVMKSEGYINLHHDNLVYDYRASKNKIALSGEGVMCANDIITAT